jgi:hypothetical protein
MTRRSCPHCAKPIDVDVRVWEYDDEPHVELVRVHVWEQCTFIHGAYQPPAPAVGYVRSVAVGGAPCSWLGPTCNDASHVTPCYAAWYARRPTCLRVARGELVGVGHDTCIGSET